MLHSKEFSRGSISGDPIGSVLIGTAAWGQKVGKAQALSILECFYERGFKWVDTSTNYPIDRISEHFGQTLDWLLEFGSTLPDLRILVKAGAATNQGDSNCILNVSYLESMFGMLLGRFQNMLGGLAIHWDDGGQTFDRRATIDFLANLSSEGFAVGLSGISNLGQYASFAADVNIPWIYQTNASPIRIGKLERDTEDIRRSLPGSKIFGYNLLGGISRKNMSNSGSRRSEIMAALADVSANKGDNLLERVLHAVKIHGVDGVIVGPSNVEQALEWCASLDRLAIE